MKKYYVEPEAKIVNFEPEDIITASSEPGSGEIETGEEIGM